MSQMKTHALKDYEVRYHTPSSLEWQDIFQYIDAQAVGHESGPLALQILELWGGSLRQAFGLNLRQQGLAFGQRQPQTFRDEVAATQTGNFFGYRGIQPFMLNHNLTVIFTYHLLHG
jgi:hypothetical protein